MQNYPEFDRPIAFHRAFVRFGGVNAALMLSQACYWTLRLQDGATEFYKTQAEWEVETGLGRREQESARRELRKYPFWGEHLCGLPAQLHYTVNLALLSNLLGGKRHDSMAESAIQARRKAPCIKDTEITTETTAETTKIAAPEKTGTARATWDAYSQAYEKRYGVIPIRNAQSNALVSRLVRRIGHQAPTVAEFYLTHPRALYLEAGHPLNLLLRDCEKLATEAATGTVITHEAAHQAERTASNPFVKLLREQERGADHE